MIRELMVSDFEHMMPFLSRYASDLKMPFKEESMREMLQKMIDNPDVVSLVYADVSNDLDQSVLGLCAFVVTPFFFSNDHKAAMEIFFYADPEIENKLSMARILIEMLDEMELRVREKKADIFYLALKNGTAFDKYLLKSGYNQLEHTYIKRIEHGLSV